MRVWCAAAPKPCQTYTVKQGDSFWSISATVGVTVDELIAANPDSTTIYAGQVLRWVFGH